MKPRRSVLTVPGHIEKMHNKASGSQADLADEAHQLLRETDAALSVLEPSALERRFVPSQELWGDEEVREISVREALLAVVEHASIHLGELHVTRDLALREA